VSTWTEPQLVDHLLGRLAPAQQDALEEAVFDDNTLHQELQATADDLIHSYLAGRLAAEDCRPFETHFLASPAQRERVEFIRELLTQVRRRAERASTAPRSRSYRLVLRVAAVVIVGTGIAWWALRVAPSEGPPNSLAGSERTPTPIASRSVPPSPAGDTVVVLSPSSPHADVVVAESSPSVRFEVSVSGRDPSYDVVLQNRAGIELWRGDELPPPGVSKPLAFAVPAGRLADGEYRLVLHGEILRNQRDPPTAAEYTIHIRRTR
jgi:hypothetical protein